MLTRFARITSRLSIALTFLFGIAACGGGGGSGGGFIPDTSEPADSYTMLLELTDADGNASNSASSTSPLTLTVTITEGNTPQADAVVKAESPLGVIVPLNTGTALTNSEGIAQFRVEAGSEIGAATITVSSEIDTVTISESINFEVVRPDLRLGHFEGDIFVEAELGLTPTELTSGGSSAVTVAIVDSNDLRVTTTETINLNSGCTLNGDAIMPASVVTSTGQATVTYTADGCEGDDIITATLQNSTSQATGTLNIAPSEVGSLKFVSADPAQIALKGTGGTGRQETSDVTFITVDGQGSPISGVFVSFSLTTQIGGLSLAEPSGTTDAEGIVVATVQSGNVATTVGVIASVKLPSGETRSTISDALVVSTGLPDANSISLSTSVLNVGGALDFDGKTATLTVRMADKFNNPVADGTSALFATEYGAIEPTCSTVDGACSVTWTSQAPRFPTFDQDLVKTISDSDYSCRSHNGSSGPCPGIVFQDNLEALGTIRGLRNTIAVAAIGEEFFIDENGNGLYDEGEPFENLPEAFLDNNEDGVYTPAIGPQCPPPNTEASCAAEGAEEIFADFNQNGEYSLNVSPEFPNGVYNGSLCPPEGDGVFCSKELLQVSDSLVMVMSSQSTFSTVLVRGSSVVTSVAENSSYTAFVADEYNNQPAGGSTVSLSFTGDCKALGESSFSVVDSNARGAFVASPIQIEGGGCPGTMTVSVNASGGTPSTRTYSCSTTVADPNNPPAC
jgi:hypothetical protein